MREQRMIKIPRELAREYRAVVSEKYGGDMYGNLGAENERAIQNHIQIMRQEIETMKDDDKAQKEKETAEKTKKIRVKTGN